MAASSNLISKLSTLEVSNAISRLTVEETRQLVFQMGVPLKVLDDIAEAYKGENRKHHYVQAWLDMTPDSSWDKLVAGLRNINMNSLATAIESEHHPKALSTCDPSLPKPAAIPASVTSPHANSVEEVEANIEHLEKEFSDIKFKTRQSLTKKEKQDSDFFERFREHLLELPVAKKQVHIRFFSRNEDEILKAKNIQKLFIILGRYCNYSNYEIIFHIVKRFCHDLKGRMTGYRDSLIAFEKSTTVDVYLCAISARPGGKVSEGFIRMTLKINKPPSECSLYEIRELKGSIEEAASLEPYAMYIETPGEGSVCVGLQVHEMVGWMVGVAFTPNFKQIHLVTDVDVIDTELWDRELSKYLNDELISASARGDVKVMTSLITAGVDVNVKNLWPGNCAITSAARDGRTEVVSLLLVAGAKVDLQDEDGDSALMEAAREGRTEVVSLLLVAGANIDLRNYYGHSALMLAAMLCRTDIVSLLLEAGANTDLQNENGDSALMLAVRRGRTEVVSLLIEARANIDLQNEDGDSAVIIATTKYNLSVLKELVRAGADLNRQNREGLTALIISSRSGRTDITEILLSGDNIALDIQTTNGWSALFFAVDEGYAATTELLLKAGANPHLRDYNGLTALDIAAGVPSLLRVIGLSDRSHRAVRHLLRSYMRKPSKLEALPAESSQKPPQSADSSQEPPQPVDSSHEPPQSVDSSQEPPQLVDSSQEPPQSVDSPQEPPQSVGSSQEPPQSVDSHESAVTALSQSLLKLVKSARQAAKQAFDRLESRVLRPDKVKIEGVESEVRGQEGEERVKQKPRLHPPLEQSSHDEYWTSLAPHN